MKDRRRVKTLCLDTADSANISYNGLFIIPVSLYPGGVSPQPIWQTPFQLIEANALLVTRGGGGGGWVRNQAAFSPLK